MTAAHAAAFRSVWRRRVAKYSRWLHIYVSMISFGAVFFFSVTGLTLNHAERFLGDPQIVQAGGQLNAAWTNTGAAEVDKLQVVEYLRTTHHITGAVVDLRTEDPEVTVAFKGPGYTADVVIDRKTGKYDLNETRMGFVAIINDLHKGRDSGDAWKLLIDVSAAILTFVSLTGLVLLYFIHKHRVAGAVLLALGSAALWILYVAWVP